MKRFLILSLVVLSSIFSIEVSSASDWQLAVSLSEGYVSLFTFDGSVLSLADQKKETASAGFVVTRFNPVAPFLVTGAAGSNWSIWNVASNTLVKTYFSGTMPMISASWHPSGTRLAIYTLVGFIPQLHVYSFDILTGLPTLIVSFNVQANTVFPRSNLMAWDKTGEYIALGLDAAVDVWQLRVYKYDDMASSLIPAGGMSIPQHYTLTGLDWGPNGQYILLGQDANTLPITYPYANVIEYQPNLITPNAPTFISKFNNSGNENVIILDKYINSSTKLRCKCKKCDNEWKTLPTSLLRGHGCPKCGNKDKGKLTKLSTDTLKSPCIGQVTIILPSSFLSSVFNFS